MTNISIHSEWNNQLHVDGYAVFVPQDEKEIAQSISFLHHDESATLVAEMKHEKFNGKQGEVFSFPLWMSQPARRIIIIGLGPQKDITDEVLRKAGAIATRVAGKTGVGTLAFRATAYLPKNETAKDVVSDIVEGILLSQYSFKKYQSEDENSAVSLKNALICHTNKREFAGVEQAAQLGALYVNGALHAADLVNEPSSHITPKVLVRHAQEIASKNDSISCTVLDKKELEKRGFGCILGVARGSDEPPYLIHVTYTPKVRTKKKVFLVGKGITFDSGGISIKPADSMENMKMDMAGGAAVLGVFSQIAALAPKVEVHGIIAACENMPSGNAVKPGDVLTAYNKKTVEVLNTDAEGRLVLADACAYAVDQKADMIIDLATLTGACIVALGPDIAGLFGTDQRVVDKIKNASDDAGEKMWQLPLEQSYEKLMKSDIADFRNISSARGVGGGAITGALFIKNFVGDTPWAHIDIAGPAWANEQKEYTEKGATGFGVRTLLRFLKEL
ncbi:MAG TPA: leucyl aminopeptidase [Patescibacteria group bacterium]|nr:leucyl aminopeptidase [Patescibacteria group bacterium]